MEGKVYEYKGKHFVPVKKLEKGDAINLWSDKELGLSKYEWKKEEYSYEEFYKAMENSEADIFLCKENGILYIPGENELFGYGLCQMPEK